MKILAQDRKLGEIKLKAENLDDLWQLSRIIQPGDLVRKRTFRKMKLDFEGRTEVDKKPMTLSVRVEKVEFAEFESAIRVSGLVEAGPEDVSGHHTLSIEPGDSFVVTKQWSRIDLERIRESRKETPKAVLCAADKEDAVFATLKPDGFRVEFTISSHLPRKDDASYEAALNSYYSEVAEKLKSFGGMMIVGGPGFVKDHIANLVPGAIAVSASSASESGIREMLESDALDRFLGENRVREEASAVNELLKRIAQDGACAYGFADVKASAESGAVELVLLSEQTILEKRRLKTYTELEALVKSIEDQGGKLLIVSSEGEHGRKLTGLGGIAALLRYRVK